MRCVSKTEELNIFFRKNTIILVANFFRMNNALEKFSFLIRITFVKANEDFMKFLAEKMDQQNENEKKFSKKAFEEQIETIEILTKKLGLLSVHHFMIK